MSTSEEDDSDPRGPGSLAGDTSHEDGRTRRKPEGSKVAQHASLWENPGSASQTSSSVSRHRTNIPARHMSDLSAKINATRQKFNQAQDGTSSSSSSKPKSDTAGEPVSKLLHRGRTDFSQLLQKFSGSEASASEKSDCENVGLTSSSPVSGIPRRGFVRRQEAKEIISSSDDSESARRTPERTQSLKLTSNRIREDGNRSSESPGRTGIEKSSSFRSDFMSRRLSQRRDEGSDKESTEPAKQTSAEATVKTVASPTSNKPSASESGTLSGVTSEPAHPEKTSSPPTDLTDGAGTWLSGRGSQEAISKAEDYIKRVETTISTARSKRSAEKSKSPSLGIGSTSASGRTGATKSSDDTKLRAEEERAGSFINPTEKPVVDESSASDQAISGTGDAKSESEEKSTTAAATTAAASSSHLPSSQSASHVPDTLSAVSSSSSSSIKPDTLSLPSVTTTSAEERVPSPVSSTSSISPRPGEAASSDHSFTSSSSSSSSTISSTIRRSASLRDNSFRSDSVDKQRKGILKRTSSMSKSDGGSSDVIVDPQLAKILQQRREIQGDVEEEDEEVEEEEEEAACVSPRRRRSRALSAAEEIEETLK
ncbi:uncharacterized serine-rich protein C215.13 [Aplysia californica]|uniref:Uncharacterized serine-rich protein C215.13 n=1 Tax=Aplysia californica TaxID=6500 RepID=A0ABM1AD07_APLCA|nr:uncharacterized serine-rich protein C215.13 [Aplysia californica]